ncbi:MAG: hypothetical protein ACYC5O_17190 [Anaerolineae bacterium]
MEKRPGCLTLPALLTTAVVALLVLAALLVTGGRLFSPGPLSTQAGLVALGGVDSHAATAGHCAACHPAPWSGETMADRCLACHAAVATQLTDPASLHGSIAANDPAVTCRACHPEHRGATAALTEISFQRFPHEAVGFSLQAHRNTASGTPFACTDCHTTDLLHFDQATCTGCHEDIDAAYVQVHVEAFGSDCLACHDGVDRYGGAFDHDRPAFPLQGKHATLACSQCHAGARTVADLSAAPQDCYSCHQQDDAHQGQLGHDCGACHTATDWAQASFDHAKSAFPLTGAHAEVTCDLCHTGGQFQGTPAECSACHEEPAFHAGLFQSTCADCHTTAAWSPAEFSGQHTFPINHGERGTNACTACHPDTLASYTCYTCHDQAEMAAKHREEGISDLQDCVRCHPTGRGEEGGD